MQEYSSQDLEGLAEKTTPENVTAEIVDGLARILKQGRQEETRPVIEKMLESYYAYELLTAKEVFSSLEPYRYFLCEDESKFRGSKVFSDFLGRKNRTLCFINTADDADFESPVRETRMAAYVRALDPVVSHLKEEKLVKGARWSLAELFYNGLNSYLYKTIGNSTGLSHDSLLNVFRRYPSEVRFEEIKEDLRIFESRIGCTPDSFGRMSYKEKYNAAGISLYDAMPAVLLRYDGGEFEYFARFKGSPFPEQHRELERRFMDYENTRKEIEELRKKYAGKDEIVRIPSLIGGGGFGILEAIRVSRMEGRYFEYIRREYPMEATLFRMSSLSLLKGLD